eukprot:scaffold441_cov139-Skeletonema_marinoi.AAC.2
MDSNVEDDCPSVHTEQDFVATALLALKRGPSMITLSSSSSSASLDASGTSREHADEVAATAQDVYIPSAISEETPQEPSTPPRQPSLTAALASQALDDDHVDIAPVPQQEFTNVSPQRLYRAKFIPPSTKTRHQVPQQKLREKTLELPTSNHSPSKGIIQRRWSNMKNINKNMDYRPYHRQHQPIIAVPPVRPLHRPPVQVSHPPPHGDRSFRSIAYRPAYDVNVARRVSDAATVVASAGIHSRSSDTPTVINLTVSNDDYDYVGSNENNDAANINMHYDLGGPILESEGPSSSSRNGGPLSQIYNEHRKLSGFYHPIQQQQLVAKQPLTAASTATAVTAAAATAHYGSVAPQAPITKKPRSTPARLPKHITEYLKHWMNTHINYPYPSEREKEMMMYDTGIDRKRLDVWLRNNRNRYAKGKRKQSSHMFH